VEGKRAKISFYIILSLQLNYLAVCELRTDQDGKIGRNRRIYLQNPRNVGEMQSNKLIRRQKVIVIVFFLFVCFALVDNNWEKEPLSLPSLLLLLLLCIGQRMRGLVVEPPSILKNVYSEYYVM